MNVCCVLPQKGVFPGVSAVFEHGQKEGLWGVVYVNELVNIGHDLDREGADVLIFGAWDPTYSYSIRRIQDRKKGILWTSPLNQMEFAPAEIEYAWYIRKLLERGNLDFVWCGSEDTVKLFGDKAFHEVYPIHLRQIPEYATRKGTGRAVPKDNVSIFCPQSARKNIVWMMRVVKALNKHAVFNGLAPHYQRLADMMGLHYADHGWMSEEEYYKTISLMDFGLQLSHRGVESFNYVVADHMMMNVPCIHSIPVQEPAYFAMDWEGILQAVDFMQKDPETPRQRIEARAEQHNKRVRKRLETLGQDYL